MVTWFLPDFVHSFKVSAEIKGLIVVYLVGEGFRIQPFDHSGFDGIGKEVVAEGIIMPHKVAFVVIFNAKVKVLLIFHMDKVHIKVVKITPIKEVNNLLINSRLILEQLLHSSIGVE